jgi:hypothetical protein
MDNYKFAIINGEDNSEKDIQAGKVERYGNIEFGDLNHIDYLMEYIDNKFSDVPMFKSLNNRHTPEIAAFLISRLGYIVFLNATKNAKRYGKTGIFIMPDEITDKQKEALYSFYEEIKDFSVTIIYNLKIVDGFLDGVNLAPVNKEDSKKLLDSFFSKLTEDQKENIIK